MNEKHAYEKHLAEKLQQLPSSGGVDQNWPRMKQLLDDEMPRGGGYRWRWIVGVVTGLLILGGWMAGYLLQDRPLGDERMAKRDDQKATTANLPKTAAGTTGTGTGATTAMPAPGGQPGNNPPGASSSAVSPETPLKSQRAGQGRASAPVNQEPHQVNIQPATAAAVTKDRAAIPVNSKTEPGKSKPVYSSHQQNHTTAQRNNFAGANNDGSLHKTTAKAPLQNKIYQGDDSYEAARELYPAVITSSNALTKPVVDPSIDYKSFTKEELSPGNTANAKAVRRARAKQERSVAFGLSLPLAFPLGDQKALSYNINAGVNSVSDYLPSPHLQYHLNEKTYLQTEVQLMSPQYIRPLLLYQYSQQVASTNSYIDHSVYARKLYYFNLPVGIHHSPFKNFYLGTGLQFSSLISGIASYEERKRSWGSAQGTLIGERFARFKSDSLSQRLGSSEMRLLLEMNYYFNRFTVGLRYNQAFSNYASFQVNSNAPYTFDKNKALQFYLRYNIWESRNK